MLKTEQGLDPESEAFLKRIAEQKQILTQRVPGTKTVLVVISARGMVFDIESMRHKIVQAYPEAQVFFRTTLGIAVGQKSPKRVDLLIDFTGPRQRQAWFHDRALRKIARMAVGRNAGLFRKKLYDRVFDESAQAELPRDVLARERYVQRKVFESAGVTITQQGDAGPDRGKTIALELPPIQALS
jgi:hypothetical protein